MRKSIPLPGPFYLSFGGGRRRRTAQTPRARRVSAAEAQKSRERQIDLAIHLAKQGHDVTLDLS